MATVADPITANLALTVPCPHCKAETGAPCVTPRSRPAGQPHGSRETRALEAAVTAPASFRPRDMVTPSVLARMPRSYHSNHPHQ